jgi:hypothetical protein
VTEWLEDTRQLRALSFWVGDGHYQGVYEYDITNTPCEPVIERQRLIHVPDRLIELYPGDPDLPPLGAVSYMGVAPRTRLRDLEGRTLNLERALPEDVPPAAGASAPIASPTTSHEHPLTDVEIRQLERDNMIHALTKANWKIAGAGSRPGGVWPAPPGGYVLRPCKYLPDVLEQDQRFVTHGGHSGLGCGAFHTAQRSAPPTPFGFCHATWRVPWQSRSRSTGVPTW